MFRRLAVMSGAGAYALLGMQSAFAQDAKSVITKVNAVYKNMKSLKAIFVTDMTAGPNGTASVKTDVEMIKGKKAHVRVAPQGKGTGKLGEQLSGQAMELFDNGTNSFMYLSKQNSYMKQPHNPNIFNGMAASLGLPVVGMNTDRGTYKMLPAAKVDGKPVYVIEYTSPDAKDGSKAMIYVDQSNYHIRQAKMVNGGAAAGNSMTTTVKNEVFDASIPDKSFAFTPPAGAKEMQMQTRPQGGAPGGAPPAPKK